LKIFDTLSKRHHCFEIGHKADRLGKKTNFKIFVCGPTVYDYCHLGHARVFLFYDLVSRFLRQQGTEVTFVMNITDIDPKISDRARLYGCATEKISTRFTDELYLDLSQLGITGISFARVSDYVVVARHLVLKLLEKDMAYSLNGNVYLDTSRTPLFGQLSAISRHRLEDMRLDLAPNKRSPNDLLLWNTTDDIGYRYYDKTLGSGFPSAHLQDLSVLIALFKGKYQLHGGAADLIYPHHESILGQLNALSSVKHSVECWTHVGLFMNHGKKMSNSLDNAIRIRKTLQHYNSNIVRMYMLSEHYRKPMLFSESRLRAFEKLDKKISKIVSAAMIAEPISSGRNKSFELMKNFVSYIENDFDTVNALQVLTDMAEVANASASFLEILRILGLHY
jgi:cysteinyl-tRNA synthetase